MFEPAPKFVPDAFKQACFALAQPHELKPSKPPSAPRPGSTLSPPNWGGRGHADHRGHAHPAGDEVHRTVHVEGPGQAEGAVGAGELRGGRGWEVRLAHLDRSKPQRAGLARCFGKRMT